VKGHSTENVKKEIKYDENNMSNIIAFDIRIPDNAKRSYNCMYSEYYWLLEAKANIPGSRSC
jgi:hypothetical protein